EAVRVSAVWPGSRVEMELVTFESPGLVDHPVHEPARVSLLAVLVSGAEVIAVQRLTPREVMDDPKPRDGGGVKVLFGEKPDQAVALRAQHLVDVVGERQLGAD